MQTVDAGCISFHDFTSYLKLELNAVSPPSSFDRPYIEVRSRYPLYGREFDDDGLKCHVQPQLPVPGGGYASPECGNVFHSFQPHMTDHQHVNATGRGRPKSTKPEGKDDKPFICEICAKGFKSKQQLTTHNVTHTNFKRFSCVECLKSFKLKAQLNTHMKVHSDVRPFACDQCDKRFKLKQQLENHFRSHSDVRPFRCGVCEKAFKFKQQRQIHSRVHDDLRPFQCELCQKSFKLKQQLQSHRKVHSDEKPFSCERCLKGFKFKQQLQTHYKSHYKDAVKEKAEDKIIKPPTWEWGNVSVPLNTMML